MAEDWRPVPEWPRYEVSSEGRLRRLIEPRARNGWASHRLLSPSPNQDGYLKFILCRDGQRKHVTLHRLVALAFIGPPPSEAHVVAHGDGDRTNNRPGNLRWAEVMENAADTVRHGRQPRGAGHPGARLTPEQVRCIRAAKGQIAAKQLARSFDVSLPLIYAIWTRRLWADLG